MGQIGKIVKGEPTVVGPSVTVLEAVEAMCRDHRGACAVVEAGRLLGVFSERDLMLKVVLRKLDPARVNITEVFTSRVITATPDMKEGQAFRIMVTNHIRHLPLIDADGRFVDMLSLRNMLQHRVDDLMLEVDSLQRYISADALGG